MSRKRAPLKSRGKAKVPQAPPPSKARFPWAECAGWIFLGILFVLFLATSWRKWPDALLDFGRELYTPWRLAHGGLLYRAADEIFGPLSQYANAALFRVFGTSMMVLITANLIVFVAILCIIHVLFREAWGRFATFISSAIFIAVFGFGQYIATGNYNYATPYSHEATHGMLVCGALLLALVRWVEDPTVLRSSLAGLLLGLTALLKAEFLVAAGLISLAALFVRWRYRKQVPIAAAACWTAAAVLPTLCFAIYFSLWLPWREGLANAARGWLNAIQTTGLTADPAQIGFLGLDRPRENLIEHATAIVLAALVIAGICGAAWIAERSSRLWERIVLTGLVVGGMGWLSVSAINWLFAGRCLLGLAVIYVLISASSLVRATPAESDLRILTLRLLTGLLAVALMARMFLNGRIYQYGFYQAALAGLLIPAIMIGELPARLGFRIWGKTVMTAGTLALLVPGVMVFVITSQDLLSTKTLAIGKNGDQFYTYPPEAEPTGDIIRLVSEYLGKFSGPQTLVVLPEGEMINYLLRMPNPVAPFIFYSVATSQGREAKVVNDLQRRPPDWVVIISRDLREYGIQRYGEADGKGKQILRWVADNYDGAASIGDDDPLDPGKHGAVILRHRGSPAR